MHTYVRVLAVLSLLLLNVDSLQAQTLPWAMNVDSSLRLELLIGSQTVSESSPAEDQLDRFKFISCPSLPVLSGAVELSPIPRASGRLAGAISVWEPSRELSLNTGTTTTSISGRWNARPQYSFWEAAGLIHFCNSGGYRFSGIAGYRGKTWKYYGQDDTTSSGRDEFSSRIPFLGLQTSMYFPLWKARFEVLGSPFMNTVVQNSINNPQNNSGEFHLRTDRGGMIEFLMEGSMKVSPSILCGLSARLTYEELFGPLQWSRNGERQRGMDAHLIETLAFFGLDMTILF